MLARAILFLCLISISGYTARKLIRVTRLLRGDRYQSKPATGGAMDSAARGVIQLNTRMTTRMTGNFKIHPLDSF